MLLFFLCALGLVFLNVILPHYILCCRKKGHGTGILVSSSVIKDLNGLVEYWGD
jgi:hypothetical protein